jgi:hypothetical protein
LDIKEFEEEYEAAGNIYLDTSYPAEELRTGRDP